MSNFDDLTKGQKYLLVSLYKEYINRQKYISAERANYFSDSDSVKELLSLEYTSDYTSDLCWKLYAKGYIECTPGDDLANDITLTDQTIVYMENRFASNVKAIVEFLLKLKS